MRKEAGLEIESCDDKPGELHVYPRESRRGKALWAIWVKPDGSGFMFIGNEQVHLPANGKQHSTHGQTLQRVGPDDFALKLTKES